GGGRHRGGWRLGCSYSSARSRSACRRSACSAWSRSRSRIAGASSRSAWRSAPRPAPTSKGRCGAALASPPRGICEGVRLRAGRRVAAGLVVGFAVALVASRALRSLLFGIAPLDAPTYGIVFTIVLVAVAIAAWLPARRALVSVPHAVLRES